MFWAENIVKYILASNVKLPIKIAALQWHVNNCDSLSQKKTLTVDSYLLQYSVCCTQYAFCGMQLIYEITVCICVTLSLRAEIKSSGVWGSYAVTTAPNSVSLIPYPVIIKYNDTFQQICMFKSQQNIVSELSSLLKRPDNSQSKAFIPIVMWCQGWCC